MLNGIRIFASDQVWRQILSDLNATVLDAPTPADINFDDFNITPPISPLELKTLILGASDNTDIINQIFGRSVALPRLHGQIVVALYKSGGMTVAELKDNLGYAQDASTHTVETAISQLRKAYGREFIINTSGVYQLGRV